MRQRTVAIAVCIIIAATMIAGVVWLCSGPDWLLSVNDTADGASATITTTASEKPVYTVRVKGWKIRHPLSGLSCRDVKNAHAMDAETMFFDGTVRPGRWTVQVGEVKLDIMPARLVVNDKHECAPGESLELGL